MTFNFFVMSEVVGCCGITCSDCEVFRATQKDDDDARALILNRDKERFRESFHNLYGREYRLEDINCDGCPTKEGRVFWYIKNCKIRACAINRDHDICAHCCDYPCANLEKLHKESHVDARRKLDEILYKQ